MGTDNKEKIILATLTGVASGVILGLLFAPEKGEETRKRIGEKREEYLNDIKKEIASLRENIDKRTQDARKDLDDLGKEAKNKRDDLLKRAKKLTSYDEWTKDELYEKAKRMEIEGYSTMNKDELIEALRKN